jgi:hypothetical protein
MSEKNLPGNKEKCFFLTSPFIEPICVNAANEIKSRGDPPTTMELFHQLAFFVLSCKPISYCRFQRIDVYIL